MRTITPFLLTTFFLCVAANTHAASSPPPVQIIFVGYTNDAVRGRQAILSLTNSLKHDILFGQAFEEKTRTGWPVYPGGGRLPHSAFVSLDAQTNVTFSIVVPTNGRQWRISVVYQDLQTRRGEDFGGFRTAIADKLRPKQKYQAQWIWSTEMSE